MNNMIHSTACIHKNAEIDNSAMIGPYCVIGENVKLKANVKLHSHVCIEGITLIDENTEVFPFSSIGQIPQDLKYNNEQSILHIGKSNVIREHVTINTGTAGDNMLTKIGNNCLLMVGVHIAHDCVIGDNVIIANNTNLGGHVHIGDGVRIGGMSAFHQKVKIGKMAMIGGGSMVSQNVIPYGLVMGERAYLEGFNIIGMKRAGVKSSLIRELMNSYDLIFLNSSEDTIEQRAKMATKQYKNNSILYEIEEFISVQSAKGICMPLLKK